MQDEIEVISLFDGISCGRVALERASIPVKSYTAYEINPAPIIVSNWHYPDIVQKGTVEGADFRQWADLLIGGSPCQGFSFAGKQLNFDDPRSRLFFEYVRALEELRAINPDILFLLENVVMSQLCQDVITDYLGVSPIKINSALVSAQTRKRLYWTNIPGIEQPEDHFIFLRDILEVNPHRKYKVKKTPSRDKMYYGGGCKNITHALKANCLTTKMDRWANCGLVDFEDYARFVTPVEAERLQGLPDGYTEMIPDIARWEALGNGWQVDTIAHLFKNIPLAKLL